MLIGLGIRDVILIERLDLAFGPGLTALTGETGAGKSIILDAMGLAAGRRADAALVRTGADQASASVIFAPGLGHPVWSVLEARGLGAASDEELVLRRTLSSDGRSRAFVNDQPATAAVLREVAALLVEVHGQHEAVGLLDPATHRPLLDAFGDLGTQLRGVSEAWSRWRAACARADALEDEAGRAAARSKDLASQLSELDRLDPRPGEAAALAEESALLATAEKTLADIAQAAQAFDGGAVAQRLGAALRALGRARERALAGGASGQNRSVGRLVEAAQATERALSELTEAEAAVDAALAAFEFQPARLDEAQERLFALRSAARRLAVTPEDLPALRVSLAERLRAIEDGAQGLATARAERDRAHVDYLASAERLSSARRDAAERLAIRVEGEFAPLKLQYARFRVTAERLADERAGPSGVDRVQFEISTNPGDAPGPLASVASGGELARVALALKVALATRWADSPLMIFDEVDQGVGGAVADAVGQRLQRLAAQGQVLVVTHSPQIAARADHHWRVLRRGDGARVRTEVDRLAAVAREEEIARMLAGAEITDAARAAARALMHA